MKRQATIVLAMAALLLTTIMTQAQPRTRASDMQTFVPAFWRTMPEVSPLCQTIVNEVMYATAGQLHTWDADSYAQVLMRTKGVLISEPVTTDREVISQLDWLECRDVVMWGLNNRQPTQQELPAIRQAKAKEVERRRLEAERKRRLEVGEQFADSCEAQGGSVGNWQSYLIGHVDQLECRGLEAAREREKTKQECLRGGGAWEKQKLYSYSKCRCLASDSSWNTTLKRCETYDERHERQAKRRCQEVQGTWDPSHERHGPCVTPKELRLDAWDKQQAGENERVRREREQARAEKQRKLEERRRQLNGG